MKKFIFVALSLLFVKQGFGASPSPELQLFDLEKLAKYCIEAEDPEQFFNEMSVNLLPESKYEFEAAVRIEADKILNLEDIPSETSKTIDQLPITEILNKFKKICLVFKSKSLIELVQEMQKLLKVPIDMDASIDNAKFLISFNIKIPVHKLWYFFTENLNRFGFKITCISEKKYVVSR